MSALDDYHEKELARRWMSMTPLEEAGQKAIAELEVELITLRCCCKCAHSDHDYYDNWWCELDPETDIPGGEPSVDPHENCHWDPSCWVNKEVK